MEVEVKLSQPFKDIEGVTRHSVKMRTRLLVGDWRYANKATKDPEERTFFMLVRLCRLDIADLEQLAMNDFQKLAEQIDLGTDDPKAR